MIRGHFDIVYPSKGIGNKAVMERFIPRTMSRQTPSASILSCSRAWRSLLNAEIQGDITYRAETAQFDKKPDQDILLYLHRLDISFLHDVYHQCKTPRQISRLASVWYSDEQSTAIISLPSSRIAARLHDCTVRSMDMRSQAPSALKIDNVCPWS